LSKCSIFIYEEIQGRGYPVIMHYLSSYKILANSILAILNNFFNNVRNFLSDLFKPLF
jgi:hypothetical protein